MSVSQPRYRRTDGRTDDRLGPVAVGPSTRIHGWTDGRTDGPTWELPDIAVDAIHATAFPSFATALVAAQPLVKEDSCPWATSLRTDKPTAWRTDGRPRGRSLGLAVAVVLASNDSERGVT